MNKDAGGERFVAKGLPAFKHFTGFLAAVIISWHET